MNVETPHVGHFSDHVSQTTGWEYGAAHEESNTNNLKCSTVKSEMFQVIF